MTNKSASQTERHESLSHSCQVAPKSTSIGSSGAGSTGACALWPRVLARPLVCCGSQHGISRLWVDLSVCPSLDVATAALWCLVRPTRNLFLLARNAEPADGHLRQLSHRKE